MVTRNIFQVWVILHFFHTVILSGKVCYSYYLKSRVYKLPSKGNLYYKKIAVIFLSFVKRSYLMLFLFSHLLRKVFVTSAISLERLEVEYKNISFLLSHLYTLLGQWKGRYPLRWTYENLNTSILDTLCISLYLDILYPRE